MFEKRRAKWRAYIRTLRIAADLRQKSAIAQGQDYSQQVTFGQDLEAGIQEVEELAEHVMCTSHVSDIREELKTMRRSVERARVYIQIRDMCVKVKAAIDKGSISEAQVLLDKLEEFPPEYGIDLESLRTALEEKKRQQERDRASKDDAK